MIFKTKRLTVRPLNMSDYQVWLDGYSKRLPKTYKYDMPPINPKEIPKSRFVKILKKLKLGAQEDRFYMFSIFLNSTGQHIGSLDIATIQRHSFNWANLGYYLHNNFHGKGYAKECTKMALKIGFTKLGYKRIEAATNPDNKPSVALVKSIGMKKECIRKGFLYEDGRWQDLVVYAAISKSKKCWKAKTKNA